MNSVSDGAPMDKDSDTEREQTTLRRVRLIAAVPEVDGPCAKLLNIIREMENEDRDNRAYPSQRRLAACLNVNPRAVRTHLGHLEDLGLIERNSREAKGAKTYLRVTIDPETWDWRCRTMLWGRTTYGDCDGFSRAPRTTGDEVEPDAAPDFIIGRQVKPLNLNFVRSYRTERSVRFGPGQPNEEAKSGPTGPLKSGAGLSGAETHGGTRALDARYPNHPTGSNPGPTPENERGAGPASRSDSAATAESVDDLLPRKLGPNGEITVIRGDDGAPYLVGQGQVAELPNPGLAAEIGWDDAVRLMVSEGRPREETPTNSEV